MTDKLRDRIAAVLYEDGQRPMATAVRLADAVIAKLKLACQESHESWDTMLIDHHRYVTDWMNNYE